jgi:hypothetical protein
VDPDEWLRQTVEQELAKRKKRFFAWLKSGTRKVFNLEDFFKGK